MAPKTRGASSGTGGMKRKRVVRRPTREPTPSSSSSSSTSPDASPANIPSVQVDQLASRIITTGRKVDFELFENEGFHFGRQLIEMNLEKICSLDCPTYPGLVKEFYRNLSRGDNGLVSKVNGIGLNVTAPILSRLLDLPLSGPSTFTPEERSPALSRLLDRTVDGVEEIFANQLSLELRLLHNICGRILFPKTGRFDYVSERDIFIMDSIIAGRPFNLPQMIIWYIADCGGKRKSSLPYGMILTELFRSQGIQIDDSEPRRDLRHTDFYSLATIHRMGFIKRNGLWERKGVTEVRAEAPGPSDRAADCEAPGSSVRHSSPVPPSSSVPASAPSPAPVFDQASSSSAGFNETQLEQLRSLFIEFDSQRTNQFNQLKEDFNTLKEEIHSRYDSLSLSIGDAVQSFRSDLQRIFDRMEGIADGSGAYVHATEQLRQDINLAIIQIDSCIGKFKDEQKEEFMDIIGHLKKIVFKNFK